MKVIMVLAVASMLAAQTGDADVMLQRAIRKESVEGDLKGAIDLYKKVAGGAAKNRSAAAKALLRLGDCYEKQGNAESRKAYERLVHDFSDQTDLAAQARARLTALEGSHAQRGMVVRQAWAEAGDNLWGAVSLDGGYLTMMDRKTGDLSIRDLSSGETRHITSNKSPGDGDAEESVPSPDGKRIAYAWFSRGHGELRIINIDGTGVKTLYSDPAVRYVEIDAWSPDGKQLLAVLQRDNHKRNEMALISVSDGSVRVLKTMGFPHFDEMRFSPDGRYILYSAPQQQNSNERDIFVMAADGSYDGPLVTHPADEHVLGWTPDGRNALFTSNRTGLTSAWRIRVEDGKPQGTPELIKKDMGTIRSIGITRQGSLYYALRLSSRDVYTAEINPDTGVIVVPPALVAKRFTGGNSRPQWSQDGELLAYQAVRAGIDSDPVVVIQEIKTGRERVFAPQLSNLLLSSWLPDGSGLVVRSGADPAWAIFQKIDAKTGEVSSVRVPNVRSRDGKWSFYFTTGAVHARNTATSEDKAIYSVNPDNCCFYGLQPSPDGTTLAAAIDSKLVAIPLPVGQARVLATLGEGEKFIAQLPGTAVEWLGNRRVLFTTTKGVWSVPAEGGSAQKLNLTIQDPGELRVHADGRRIAFSAGSSRKSEVWVMENFLTGSAQ